MAKQKKLRSSLITLLIFSCFFFLHSSCLAQKNTHNELQIGYQFGGILNANFLSFYDSPRLIFRQKWVVSEKWRLGYSTGVEAPYGTFIPIFGLVSFSPFQAKKWVFDLEGGVLLGGFLPNSPYHDRGISIKPSFGLGMGAQYPIWQRKRFISSFGLGYAFRQIAFENTHLIGQSPNYSQTYHYLTVGLIIRKKPNNE